MQTLTRKRLITIIVTATVLALPLLGLLQGFAATKRRMEVFRSGIKIGSRIDEVLPLLGKPTRIVNPDEPLRSNRASFRLPARDEQTTVYVYSRDGVPYFIGYVFVDTLRQTVTASTVENLWW